MATTPLSADDYGDLKIDKVGPIEKVGPIDPVGKSKEQKGTSTPTKQDQVVPPSKPKSTITIQGTGADPVDFSTRQPAAKPSSDSGSEDSVEDVLEKMSLGGHKKEGGGGGDFSDVETSTDDNGTSEAVKSLFGATPNYQDLNAAKVLDPIERPERDAPQGMMKVSFPERPNKDPRKNFPAQAGGNSAGC